MLIRIYIL